MRRALTALVALAGSVAIVAALWLAVTLTPVTASGAGAGALAVALAGVALAAVKLYRSGDGETVAPAPWTEAGALVEGTPEETADPADVTGDELAALVDEACERAREAETVDEGVAAVRPPLREALARVLVAGETDPDAVEDVLAAGEWTDDRVAAAVVDETVDRPRTSLRGRVRAWLFPERVVRRETARTVRAIEAAADRELPPVVGQRAPRTVPTLAPALGNLQRAADGTLQRASGRPADGSASGGAGSDDSAQAGRSDDERGATDEDATDEDPSDDEAADPADLVGEVWDDA